MVRSAIRPLREVPQVTQRSQNSRAIAPQLVTGEIGVLAAGLGVQGRVSEAEQVLRLLAGLVPDRGAAGRVGHVAADQGRGRRMAGPVRRLGRRRDQRLQVAIVLQADHVDQVAGLDLGEADLDPAGRARADEHDPPPLGRAFVHQQAGRFFLLDDRPGDPADLGPDPVDDRPARLSAADNCMIALPEGGRGNRAAAPGFGRSGERKTFFATLGQQN